MALRPLLALTFMIAAALPAAAQDPAAAVVDQLRAQGYVSFEVSRTLLGRVRVLATRPEGVREIVFNPATGEILRDLWDPEGASQDAPRVLDREDDGATAGRPTPPTGGPAAPPGGSGGGGPGAGGGGNGSGGGNGGAGNGSGEGGGNGGDDDGGDGDRGHGNDDDGDDDDNPGRGGGRGSGNGDDSRGSGRGQRDD